MSYVMVPVPEEHADEVRQFLHWNVGKLPDGIWDEDGPLRLLEALDEDARALLLIAAEAAQDVETLAITDAAARVGCSEREIVGIVTELNEEARVGGLPFIVTTAVLEGSTESGPRAWQINMAGDIAWRVLAAAGKGRPIDV